MFPVPLLLTVTVWLGVGLPTAWVPKSSWLGVTPSPGLVPVPLMVTCLGEFVAWSEATAVMVSVVDSGPIAVGAKLIAMAQVWLGGTAAVHPLASALKSVPPGTP